MYLSHRSVTFHALHADTGNSGDRYAHNAFTLTNNLTDDDVEFLTDYAQIIALKSYLQHSGFRSRR